jgi:hypothetical protein
MHSDKFRKFPMPSKTPSLKCIVRHTEKLLQKNAQKSRSEKLLRKVAQKNYSMPPLPRLEVIGVWCMVKGAGFRIKRVGCRV